MIKMKKKKMISGFEVLCRSRRRCRGSNPHKKGPRAESLSTVPPKPQKQKKKKKKKMKKKKKNQQLLK
ncbi:hypothetical protein PoB_006466200 [Plakobranchus ocellatus]|uniref:Uncharacterized protein n=1 Tax=Plakobranchus ocellatus TaxID=259542 RepID=A0AAV4D1X5_9GAST|nr:hypothetical protein PoB_006466200 [Plakobranchus ocellatus]